MGAILCHSYRKSCALAVYKHHPRAYLGCWHPCLWQSCVHWINLLEQAGVEVCKMLPNQGAYWVHAVQWAVVYVGPLMYQKVWLTTTLARSEKHQRAANEQLNLGAQVNLSRSTEQGVEPRGTGVSVTDGCLRLLSVGGGPPILSRYCMPLTSSSLFPPETPNTNFLLSALVLTSAHNFFKGTADAGSAKRII